MSVDSTQSSLLSRVRDPANHEAWVQFDGKYRELIVRYCRARGLQPTDAEDVRQLVMMSLSKALPGFRYRPELGRFRDYLGRAVRNAVNKRFSRPGRSGELLYTDQLDLPSEAEAEAADEAWDREWMLHHYRQAMASVRRDFESKSIEVFEGLLAGRPVVELAAAFGLSEQAVHKIKQRIRNRLRELIAAQIHEEEFPERQP